MATLPHTKVTRDDWVAAAIAAVDERPIDSLKVAVLADTLGVSRSSFYWYFTDRRDFFDAVLAVWDVGTRSIVERAERPADTIAAACLGVFECWADRRLYDPALDLAVRDWARRDTAVAELVHAADQARTTALTAMFRRHGYPAADAVVRARLVYHSQVGYYAVGTSEPTRQRLDFLPHYLRAMTGSDATASELAEFARLLADKATGDGSAQPT